MDELRASRLQQQERKPGRPGFLTDKLPYGSLQRKLVLGVGAPLLIFLILVLIADKLVMPMVTRHGEEFELPNFTDMTTEEAEVELKQLDLRSQVTSRQYSPGKDEGVILQQFPIAGTKVKSGRQIRFVTSLGKKLVPIPQLGGLSVRQAILDLESAGLTLGEISMAFSDTLPARVVFFSYPAAGTEIPLGAPVNLMVNRGRATNFTYMPKVTGMTLSEATKKIEDKGLKVGIVKHRVDENYLPETVLEQSEPEGAELDLNIEIDLVVSATP